MNSVALTGRWTKEIDFRALDTGAIAKCSIAVDEGYGTKKYTSFFDVVMFGKLAENMANHSGKGRKVLIEGRIKQERWDKDGSTQSAVRVYANNIEFLDYKDNGDSATAQPQNSEKRSFGGIDPFPDDGKPIDISDDDLPF